MRPRCRRSSMVASDYEIGSCSQCSTRPASAKRSDCATRIGRRPEREITVMPRATTVLGPSLASRARSLPAWNCSASTPTTCTASAGISTATSGRQTRAATSVKDSVQMTTPQLKGQFHIVAQDNHRTAEQGDPQENRRCRHLPEPQGRRPPRRRAACRADRRVAGRPPLHERDGEPGAPGPARARGCGA